jgi:pimeloyl-ACP methyl ester carboxylesterase
MKNFTMRYLAPLFLLLFWGMSTNGYGLEPVVFVHGGSGSGSQFESQAKRFMINGYPVSYLAVYEHSTGSGAPEPKDQIDGLDEVIDNVLEQTGETQVNLIAHSRGAGVCTYYLESSAERAAKVAHYVAVDSATGLATIAELGLTHTPGDVDMLALWGEGDQTRTVDGATNVYIPTQSHIESATSAASFVEFFKFFNGFEPKTSNIVPESGQDVTIRGRTLYFPENVGAPGELSIYEVKASTGFRVSDEPIVTVTIGEDGEWGPFKVKKNMTYEFAFVHSNGEKHYFYREPFTRSDYFVRLNTSRPGSGLGLLLTRSPNHVDLLVSRDKEIWGDQGKESDILLVDGINVATPEAAARAKRLSGLFLLDWGYWPGSLFPEAYYGTSVLGESDLTAPIPIFHAQGFLSGLDYYMPAASPPDRTIKLRLTPRGRIKKTQSVNVPNWASDQVRVTVVFNDYVH